MEKLVYKSLVIFLLFIVAVWAASRLLTRHVNTGMNKELIAAVFLLWLASILSRRDSDDDWAGQL